MSLIVKLQLDSLIWSVFMDLIIARHRVYTVEGYKNFIDAKNVYREVSGGTPR